MKMIYVISITVTIHYFTIRQIIIIPGLVLCLSNEDPNIILISLEALKYLAMYTPNRPVMKNHMGMIQSLQVCEAALLS